MTEKPARDELGLSGAEAGDLLCLQGFVNFAQREFMSLSMFSALPKPIQLKLSVIARECERAAEFVAGWAEAQKAKDGPE